MAETIDVGLKVTPDPGSFNSAASELEDALKRSAARGLSGQDLTRRLRTAFTQLGRSTAGLGAGFDKEASRVRASAARAVSAVDALNNRVKALRSTFSGTGTDPSGLLIDPRALAQASRALEHFAANRERAFASEGVRKTITSESQFAIRQIEALEREVRSLARLREEDSRRNRELTIRNQQSVTKAEAQAARERIAIMQQEGAQTLAETRSATQRRVAIIQAGAQQIRALERGLAAVFRTTARGIGTLASGAGRGLSGLASQFRRSNTQISTGLGSAMSRRESIFRSSLSRQERVLSSSISAQSRTLQRFETQLSRGFTGAATGRGIGGGLLGGLAAGGGLIGLLTSGFQRFGELERIQKQFTALLQNEQEALKLIEKLKNFAKVTPFDLVGVSDLAKGFLAIGFAADDVLPAVSTIADAVALTGGGTDELVRIQRAIGQVVSAGRLQGDELNQLAENLPGLNIRKILADQLTGGDTAALVEMQEAGEISGEMFVTGILEGLRADPRLEGASEDLAKTLTGRLANLKESFADFGASLIGLVAEPLAAAFGRVGTALAEAAAFIRGEDLSEGLEALRTALGGAAAAIAGLLAARVAGEAFQFLLLGVRALLSPFGLLIAVVGGIGALIAVALREFPALRLAFEGIADQIGRFLAPAIEFVKDKLDDLRVFINDTVIPAVADFGSALVTNILEKARQFADFFRDTVIPKLQEFVAFIRDEVIPDIQFRLGAAFRLAGAALRLFWAKAEPILEPAIDGLGNLVDAVKELFNVRPSAGFLSIAGIIAATFGGFAVGGPLGALVGGAGATVAAVFANGLQDELVGALQGVGEVISNTLGPVLETAFNAVKSVFTLDNLLSVADSFFKLVERIGEIIGGIVSSPQFVTAIAAIAAFGVRTGIAFVTGFVKGVIDNLPDLAGLLGDALREGFLLDPNAIFGGLFLLLGSAAIISRFRQSGAKMGQAIQQGLKMGTGSAGIGGGGAGPSAFLSGFFGRDPEGAARRETAKVTGAIRSEIQRNNRLLQASGRAGITGGLFDLDALRRSQTAVSNLRRELGTARTAGLQARDGIRQMTGAFTSSSPRQFFSQLKTGFGDLRAGLSGQGRNVGAAAGTAIAGALGVAFSAQLAIESEGMGDKVIGLAGVIASALGATAIGGPIVGAATLGLGAIATAFQLTQASAEKAKAEIEEYGNAIRGLDGTETIIAAQQQVFENMANESPEVLAFLEDVSFNYKNFAREVVEGSTDAERSFADMLDGLTPGLSDIADKLRDGTINVSDFLDSFGSTTGDQSALNVLRRELEEAGIDIDDLAGAFDFLESEYGELRTAFSKEIQLRQLELLGSGAQSAADHLGTLRNFKIDVQPGGSAGAIETGVTDPADDATQALEDARSALDDLLSGPKGGETFSRAVDELIADLPRIRETFREALNMDGPAGEANLRINQGDLRAQVSEAIVTGVRDGSIASIPEAEAALKDIKADIKAELPEGRARDQILGVIQRIQKSLRSPESLDLLEAAGLEITDADRRGAALGEALVNGIGGGMRSRGGVIPGAAAEAIAKVRDADTSPAKTVGEAIARSAGQAIRDNEGNLTTAATTVVGATAQAGATAALGAALVGITFSTNLASGISNSKQLVTAAGASAAASGVAGAQAGSGGMYSIGVFMAAGLASGISAGASLAINAAIRLAVAAINAARSALQISSPSRVFRNIGLEISRGLAAGMKDGGRLTVDTIQQIIDDVMQAAIDRAAVQVGRARAAVAIFDALMPRGLPGGPTKLDIERGLLAVRDAIQSFVNMQKEITDSIARMQETIRESRQAIKEAEKAFKEGGPGRALDAFSKSQQRADIARAREDLRDSLGPEFRERVRDLQRRIDEARKTPEDERTAEQRRLLREKATSLDPTSQFGRENRRAILDAGQQIRDFGRQLLEAGTPVAEVTKEMRQQRDRLIANAKAMGFNTDQIENLLRSLGLADDQLARFRESVREANEQAREELKKQREDLNEQIKDALEELRRLRAGQRTLDPRNEQGRQNRNTFLDAFERIRDFGRQLLEAGTPVAQVVARMRELRNQLVQQAVALGFNRAQLTQLLRTLGLGDDQLREFVKQIERANKARPPTGPDPRNLPPPQIIINPPYGDPEAIGLAVVNRLAFAVP